MPPQPKDKSIRQRRNVSPSRANLPPEQQPRKRAPSLPKLGDGQAWHKMTRAWWHDIWNSPMAEEYLRADEHALYRLAMLIDSYWTKPTVGLASEIRQQQQAFGLTPLDRRRLEWSIEQVEAAQSRVQAKKANKRKEREDDPRDALKHDLILYPEPKTKNSSEILVN
jgi:hypothetical protein